MPTVYMLLTRLTMPDEALIVLFTYTFKFGNARAQLFPAGIHFSVLSLLTNYLIKPHFINPQAVTVNPGLIRMWVAVRGTTTT